MGIKQSCVGHVLGQLHGLWDKRLRQMRAIQLHAIPIVQYSSIENGLWDRSFNSFKTRLDDI